MQKYANLVDLVKSFPTSIYLQKSASIQPRTSLSKFEVIYSLLFIRLLTQKISQVRERASLRAWRSHCGATLQRQLPARRKSPSPRLRTSVEKRLAPPPRMRAVLGTEKHGDFQWKRRSRRVASDSARSYRTRPFQSLPRAGVRAARRSLLAPSSTPTS